MCENTEERPEDAARRFAHGLVAAEGQVRDLKRSLAGLVRLLVDHSDRCRSCGVDTKSGACHGGGCLVGIAQDLLVGKEASSALAAEALK